MGYLLAQQLVAAGETVVDVPATLASRVRVLGSGQSTKTDPERCPGGGGGGVARPVVAGRADRRSHRGVPAGGASRHGDLARWRNKLCCRLHALVAELVPGGIAKEVVVNQARSLLDGASSLTARRPGNGTVKRSSWSTRSTSSTQCWARHRARVATAVAASGTTLTEIFGVGPIVAAMLIGYTGDPTRFATASRFAAYTGPPRSSSPPAAGSCTGCPGAATGDSTTPSTSPRSPRSATATAPAAATTTASSPGPHPREAIRALKRRLSDVVWRHLIADARRVAPMIDGPGQDTPGTTLTPA